MATHGEIQWPPVGSFDGRLWGDSHGHRQLGSLPIRQGTVPTVNEMRGWANSRRGSGCGRGPHSWSLGHHGACPDSPRECERLANTLCATPSCALPLTIEPGALAAAGARWWIPLARTASVCDCCGLRP
jgi:hypothetical protein